MILQLLLVEDNERTAQHILDMLAETPYQVTHARDGLGGLNQAKKIAYDVVLTDHKMPLMDGLTLLRNLRDCDGYQETPLLFMTTEDVRQVMDKATRHGADVILGKPLQKELLLEQLYRLAPRDVA